VGGVCLAGPERRRNRRSFRRCDRTEVSDRLTHSPTRNVFCCLTMTLIFRYLHKPSHAVSTNPPPITRVVTNLVTTVNADDVAAQSGIAATGRNGG
jgi:hypothetical protein